MLIGPVVRAVPEWMPASGGGDLEEGGLPGLVHQLDDLVHGLLFGVCRMDVPVME